MSRHLLLCLAFGFLCLSAGRADASWLLYLSGSLGTSSGTTTVTGTTDFFTPPRAIGGTYSDSSPLIAGALGVSIPLDELTAWELPYDLRLPSWRLRFEAEAVGLRSFEGLAGGPGPLTVFGGTDSWSVMFDLWQNIPLSGLGRVFNMLPGRTPRWLTRGLDQLQIYGGGGIGVVGTDINFTDNTHTATSSGTQLGWQAGTGVLYELTKTVAVDLGYRHFNYGTVSTQYIDTAGVVRGPFSVSQSSNEFRGGLRINFWGFQPWR